MQPSLDGLASPATQPVVNFSPPLGGRVAADAQLHTFKGKAIQA